MSNLFAKAAKYRKTHPHVSQAEAVKIVAAKDKKPAKKSAAAAVGRAKRKSSSSTPRKQKVKVIIKKSKKGNINMGVSGINSGQLAKLNTEVHHRQRLEDQIKRTKESMKGSTPAEKALANKTLKVLQSALKTSKQHITALKRTI